MKKILMFPKGIFIFLLVLCTSFTGTSPDANLYYYKGRIGNNTKIQMNLEFKGKEATGSYLIEYTGEVFLLDGATDPKTKGLALNVFNQNDVLVAKIIANYYDADIDHAVMIKGKLIDSSSGRTKSINLEKVAEYISMLPVMNEGFVEGIDLGE